MTWEGSDFEENLHNLLIEKKFNAIFDLLKSLDSDKYLSDNVWNIINSICLTIKTDSLLKDNTDVSQCQEILLFLVNKGNPKEVLVSLLEQADSFKDHEFFCLLLKPLQYTLQKTPGKRGKSLQWVLSTLNAHVETLPEPEDLDLQGDEKLLLDVDPAVQDTTYVLSNYLSFVEFFVDEVSFKNLKKEINYFDRISYQQELLHRYILKLFYHPLLYHDLHVVSDTRPKSTIRTICESYVKCLSKICPNVFNLFKYDSVSLNESSNPLETSSDDDIVPSLAFSNFSYLVFVENIAVDFQPFVYSNLFIFMKNLRYITLLLKPKHNLVLFKGLCLADTLLNQLDDLQLNYDCMELEVFTEFPKLLLNIAIFSTFETHRKSALKIFQLYMSKCNFKGRYHLIMQVLSTIKHSGAESLVINMYKNYLHETLNNSAYGEYLLGKNFRLFVKKTFALSEGVETDILENSDKIITALNFLRYLLLRDRKEKNFTGIWDLIDAISTDFITPLTTGLDMSRAHYKQAIKDAKTEKKDRGTLNTTVSVENKILPNVPVQFQKDLFQKALTTFDVIECILSHVKELISN